MILIKNKVPTLKKFTLITFIESIQKSIAYAISLKKDSFDERTSIDDTSRGKSCIIKKIAKLVQLLAKAENVTFYLFIFSVVVRKV